MPRSLDMQQARAAATAFTAFADGGEIEFFPLAGGLINHTFLCRRDDGRRFVLQRINGEVFADPAALMANFVTVCAHLEREIATRGADALMTRVPRPCLTGAGGCLYLDAAGAVWRLLTFIPGHSRPRPRNREEARALGRGLGRFHHLLSDLDSSSLVGVIPGFHRLSHYLEQYDAVAAGGEDSAMVSVIRRRIEASRRQYLALEEHWQAGTLTVQAIHGDPKCENFIFDDNHRVVALVDLDTVMAAPLVLDVADCVRSGAVGNNGFDPRFYHALVAGWMEEAEGLVRSHELEFVPLAIKCLFFELGLRFFTDHLGGDTWFKVKSPGENLFRAQRQFRLLDYAEKELLSIKNTSFSLMG